MSNLTYMTAGMWCGWATSSHPHNIAVSRLRHLAVTKRIRVKGKHAILLCLARDNGMQTL
jgi:hypothetical protein